MFRYEKPQKGRYRQFHQFDVEAIGFAGPDIDAELIAMTARLWRALGITGLQLQVNSLGMPEGRLRYRQALEAHFGKHRDALDEDSIRRLERNPLRILDSKHPRMQPLIAEAPAIDDFLDEDSRRHFETVQQLLAGAGVAFTINPRLVRGLDYYNRTVFEWVTDRLGSQGAVCAGGRYDGLIAQLGGAATEAIGCAIGMERLVELYRLSGGAEERRHAEVFVVAVGEAAEVTALRLAEYLRDQRAGLAVEMNCGGGGFRAQMRRADASGAAVALILGDEEVAAGTATIKPLRSGDEQRNVAWTGIMDAIAAFL